MKIRSLARNKTFKFSKTLAEIVYAMNKMSFLPKFLRIKLIRQNIRISTPPKDFQVNIASTKEELEKAYSLLHDCYVGTKLMAPDKSGLRCNFFSFLPFTTTVVAKIGEIVIGTVSLIYPANFLTKKYSLRT